MSTAPNLLIFDAVPVRSAKVLKQLREKGLDAQNIDIKPDMSEETIQAADVAVVVLDRDDPASNNPDVSKLIQKLGSWNIATVVWGAPDNFKRSGGPLVEYLPSDVSLDEVVGRLKMARRYAPILKRFDRELHHLQRLGQQLNRYFSEIDQEMRLAGRLQRDFLPRCLPHVPPVSFATLFRPASWVSGDMFDVFRIDERHIGVFLADAMGHGIAAGLLTMFLRQALVTKRIDSDLYDIINPAEAMAGLHECLLRQQLPNCQFVTAVYGIIDTTRLQFRIARGGHPYPLHISKSGEIRELESEGPLLGLPDMAPEFTPLTEHLNPGDKVILFSDGLEKAFFESTSEGERGLTFSTELRAWAALHADEFVAAVGEFQDRAEGSLHPADDVTLVVLEVA